MPSINYAYVNGRFVPEAEAKVSIFDRGFLYGDGVFETMRVYGGRVFCALKHFERLFNGLDALEIESPFTPEEFRAICRALIRYNSVTDGVARVYVTRDSTVVTVHQHVFASLPFTAIVSSVRVDSQVSRFKTANRLPYILAEHEAKQLKADDAVLLNVEGHVVEFTTSNLFVVKNGGLVTPPLTDGPLPGITRNVVCSIAEEMRMSVAERSFVAEYLEEADEVFATNSLIEITPVTSWGRERKVTARLQTAYRQLVTRELSTPGP